MARNTLYPPSVKPGIPKLGIKPKGWTETTFGKVLTVVQRPAEIKNNTEYQLVTAKRGRGGIAPREKLVGRKILTKIQYYVAEDDFLISKRQIVHGACGVVPSSLEGAIVSGEYSVLRVKDGLLLKFLDYFSHTDYFQMTCFQASVGVDVEKMIFDLKEWLNVKIYLPPVPEQEKILNIIGTWDKAISQTKKLIIAKQNLKKGLLQKLVIGSVRFPVFTKSKKWNVMEFEEIASLSSEKFNPLIQTNDLPCVELEHIEQETGQIRGYVSALKQKSIKNRFRSGQVLFGKLRPYLKKYAKPNFDGVCSSEVWVLSGTPNVCENRFLFYLVQTHRFISAANVSSGSKMPRADWEHVADSVFPIPSIPEQEKIADMLEILDHEIEILTKKLINLRTQKKGLMQKLLTGQIRVKV
ncbi:MAG: hypothetical protein KPEEDBHJ_00437 [Anaerolineales bacterium]|nr:hypothetical protein [Anaerolineales bacterium]